MKKSVALFQDIKSQVSDTPLGQSQTSNTDPVCDGARLQTYRQSFQDLLNLCGQGMNLLEDRRIDSVVGAQFTLLAEDLLYESFLFKN